MASLEEYHQEVREAILLRNGRTVMNGTVDHASIITQEAFNNARSTIKILSSRLDPSCYAHSGVIAAAKTFLADPDHRAKFLVESCLWDADDNFEWNKHPLISALAEYKNRFELRKVPKEWADGYTFNFLVLDDYGFRFEADRSRPAAAAVFMPPGSEMKDGAITNLDRIFSDLWKASKKYPVQ